MSFSDYLEGEVLDNLFLNQNIANLGDATGVQGSSTAGNVYIALFTADPTDAGTQTNEADFGGYARVAVPRSGTGWTRTGNSIANAALIEFVEATSGSNTITHFAIMDSATSGNMLGSEALSGGSISVVTGVKIEFQAGQLAVTLS